MVREEEKVVYCNYILIWCSSYVHVNHSKANNVYGAVCHYTLYMYMYLEAIASVKHVVNKGKQIWF